MKMRVLALLAALVLLCGFMLPGGAAAAGTMMDGAFTYTVTGGAAAVTGYIGPGGAVTVPDTLGGYPVAAIGPLAFTQTDITSVVIPSGVAEIGAAAFEGCPYLTDAVLPEGLTEISDSLFYYCENLRSVTIPASVNTIGPSAFSHCEKLAAADLPDGITVIGDDAFSFCASLTDMALPENLLSLGSYAFGYCTALSHLTLPEGLREIDDCAFLGCTALRQVILPSGVTRIASGLFSGCTALADITLPDGVRQVECGAFSDTPWLRDYPGEFLVVGTSLYRYLGAQSQVTVPAGVTDICADAFAGNGTVTRVTIPSGVRSIGPGAFSGCTALNDIDLPETVTDVGASAFAQTPWLQNQQGFVTAGKVLIAYTGGGTEIDIPAGITVIGDGVFAQQGALHSVTVPAAVESIGDGNFVAGVGGGDGAYETVPMDLTIKGDTGSFAQLYARTWGVAFQSLGSLRGVPTAATILIDGRQVRLEAYNINGHNFVKLRDAAAVLSGTRGQFSVDWDAETRWVTLSTGRLYSPVGGELLPAAETAQAVSASDFSVAADGGQASLTCYLLHDNNFVMLRDLLRLVNVGVTWDAAENTVSVDTAATYAELSIA